MANGALRAPGMTGPKPVAGPQLARQTSWASAIRLKDAGGQLADSVFYAVVLFCALAILAVVGLVLYELVSKSQLSWHAFGFKFFLGENWDPVNDKFGALPFIYGTLVSSLLALVLAVPLAVGVAVFTTEMSPLWLRGPLAFTTELLAAIPSVIYGLWAIFVLVPLLRQHVQPWLARYLGWTGLFEGPPYGIGMLAAGTFLAILIISIIPFLTRRGKFPVSAPQRERGAGRGGSPLGKIRRGGARNARCGVLGRG